MSAVFINVWLPFRNTPKVFLPDIVNFPLLVTVLALLASEYIPIELSPLKVILLLLVKSDSNANNPLAPSFVLSISVTFEVKVASFMKIPLEFSPTVIFLTPFNVDVPSTYTPANESLVAALSGTVISISVPAPFIFAVLFFKNNIVFWWAVKSP